jgi:hypothetical protein
VVVVSVVVEAVVTGVSVTLNCTGITLRLAGQTDVLSGLIGCCTWAAYLWPVLTTGR